MLHEISPKKFHNEYFQHPPKDSDEVAIFKGKDIYIKRDGENIALPTVGEIRKVLGKERAEKSLLYLFCIDDDSVFMWEDDANLPSLSGYEFESARAARGKSDPFVVGKIFNAWHLVLWYRDNKFCGRCGKRTIISTLERCVACECGNVIFPKIMPAIITGVRNGDKILVTRYAGREQQHYALIAGFCEFGETAEETVKREVMEEVGLKVKNVTYFATSPWGIDQDLLLGYFCDLDGDDTIKLDKNELAVGKWMDRSEVEPREATDSLTATMIEYFRLGKDKEAYPAG